VIFAKIRKKRFQNLAKNKKILFKKSINLLPNIFTLGNAFFGFCSIIFTAKSEYLSAAYFILLGALMDALDGRIARLVGAASPMGLQLDSLADSVSFCLAPALLIYFWQLKTLGFFGLLLSCIFFLAGILRLARFNLMAQEQSIFFLGLPTTIAGCFLAIFYLNTGFIYDNNFILLLITFILVFLLSILMVSRVKFPAFKKNILSFTSSFGLTKKWRKIVIISIFAFAFILQFHKTLLVLFLLYFLSALYFKFKLKML